jgi:hypothetical protein
MAFMKRAALALLLASIACGGEDDTMVDDDDMAMDSDREGPIGCYLIQRMMCDCELTREECTDEASMVWTEGCMSCM